jgi:predicted CXXCH cytochrome family protein
MRHFIAGSLLSAAFLLSSCSMQKFMAWENPQSQPAYKKGHSICEKCHTTGIPKPGAALFAPGVDPSTSCLACHDYKENHHPVDYVPADPSNPAFPVFEGKVTCLTCHQIHGGPDKEGTHNLLRGGPYQDRREICFRCHSGEKYAAINPHEMLDDTTSVRQVNGKPVCLMCHSKMPDTAEDSTDDVRFRADIGFLCWRCHPPMPDPFFENHFLVKPSAKTLNTMHQSEERLLVILPIVPRERITCSTCHNPHQKGVIQRESAAKGADTKGRLRLASICFACHLL